MMAWVAFIGYTRPSSTSGNTGVFLGNGIITKTVADNSGRYSSFWTPSVNNNGKVAFRALLDGDISKTGIFTGPDPIADKVIVAGDILLGSEVKGVQFTQYGLNDAGQIAFIAYLDSNRGTLDTVIVRADPDLINGGYTFTKIGDVEPNTDSNSSTVPFPSINNHGVVAFGSGTADAGIYGRGWREILSGDGSTLNILVDVDDVDPFLFFSHGAINDNGTVAFWSYVVEQGSSVPVLYTVSSNGNLTRVIDKSNVQDSTVFYGRLSINNDDNIVLMSRTNTEETNGGFNTGVPEPLTASLGLLGLGMIGMTSRRRAA